MSVYCGVFNVCTGDAKWATIWLNTRYCKVSLNGEVALAKKVMAVRPEILKRSPWTRWESSLDRILMMPDMIEAVRAHVGYFYTQVKCVQW